MRAIILNDFGNVDQLVYKDIPQPPLRAGEVLVKTKFIAINPVDAKTRKGKGQAARLRSDPPMILGWDISGVVADAGDSKKFKKGDEVFGMINIPGHGKAYAEYVAAPEDHLALKPANVSHAEAAAASLAAMTAWQAIVSKAQLRRGQHILIQAAAGGVGHYAVQMAKHLGAYVIGTSSAANREFVMSLGADEHVDYRALPPKDSIPEVDVVIDAIGGDNIATSLNLLKKGGTIISLPSGVSETVAEQAAQQGKTGIFFFVHSNAQDISAIADLLQEGKLKSYISAEYGFDSIREAHQQIESGRTVGKIVVRMEE